MANPVAAAAEPATHSSGTSGDAVVAAAAGAAANGGGAASAHKTAAAGSGGNVVVDAAALRDRSKAGGEGPPLPAALVPPQPPQRRSFGRRFVSIISANWHYLTFLPIIIISVLQDINILLGCVICLCVALVSVAGNVLFTYVLKEQRVCPKAYDCFNVTLWTLLTAAAATHPHWLYTYVNILVNSTNSGFMIMSMLWGALVPRASRLHVDNFVMQSVKDRLPPTVVSHPLAHAMTLWIAGVWHAALLIMLAGSIVNLRLQRHPTEVTTAAIVCVYVLGIGPMLIAVVLQKIIVRVYRPRLRAAITAAMAAAAQGGAGGGDAVEGEGLA